MKSYREEAGERLVREQAASWLSELADGNDATREAFVAWLKRSPRNVGEFLATSAVWKGFERGGKVTATEIEEAVAAARLDESSNIIALQASSEPAAHETAQARIWAMRIAACLAFVALALVGTRVWLTGRTPTYATEVGEQRAFRLVDGSLLHLNTHSRVKVNFTAQAREVRLLEGEALFTVEHDAVRPFRVNAGDTTIQALGTQFDVYRQETSTRVSVVEGLVQVSGSQGEPVKLAAGEQARVDAEGVHRKSTANLVKALAWRERRLVFQDDRLEDIVAEVNRYTVHQIHIEGEQARNKLITGTFNADDPDSLLLFLGRLGDVWLERRGSVFVIRDRGLNSSNP